MAHDCGCRSVGAARPNDVTQVLVRLPGRLDRRSHPSCRPEASLDRDPVAGQVSAADPELYLTDPTFLDQPAGGQPCGTGGQPAAPPAGRDPVAELDPARSGGPEPDHADQPGAVPEVDDQGRTVVALLPCPAVQPVLDQPLAAGLWRSGGERWQPGAVEPTLGLRVAHNGARVSEGGQAEAHDPVIKEAVGRS